jgi:hypothetical protein
VNINRRFGGTSRLTFSGFRSKPSKKQAWKRSAHRESSRLQRVVSMRYNTRDYWVFATSSIVLYCKERNVSEIPSVSIPRWGGGETSTLKGDPVMTLPLSNGCNTVLLVPRNFSRGRGVIPSLAERGEQSCQRGYCQFGMYSLGSVVRQHNVLYTWPHFKTLRVHSKLVVPTLTRLFPPLRERWYDPSTTAKVTRH